MKYCKTVTLKDGRTCCLRHAAAADGKAALDVFLLTHAETDNLLSYPDENVMDAEGEGTFLQAKADSDRDIEIIAEIDGNIVGLAGIEAVGKQEKVRHRAVFGISVVKDRWGIGIGRALTEACVECAKRAGYAQLELEVVADNTNAIALYRSVGFAEYGRNPRGFRSRFSGWQELIMMRLELD